MFFDYSEFEAILFDLDGTLIDSMPLHNEAWIEVLSENGFSISEVVLTEYTGVPNFKTVQIFNERFGWSLDPAKIALQKEDRFLEKLKGVKTIDVVVQVAKDHFGKIPMAIVTGSVKTPALKLIKMLDIEKYFTVVITAEDTKNHKPDPEPFLLGAERLGVNSDRCLVFEDGELGIQAAKAALMKVIKVVASKDKSNFQLIKL
jgi:beta-phosphoglucomutase-like phosphatase (HAD superfamily)